MRIFWNHARRKLYLALIWCAITLSDWLSLSNFLSLWTPTLELWTTARIPCYISSRPPPHHSRYYAWCRTVALLVHTLMTVSSATLWVTMLWRRSPRRMHGSADGWCVVGFAAQPARGSSRWLSTFWRCYIAPSIGIISRADFSVSGWRLGDPRMVQAALCHPAKGTSFFVLVLFLFPHLCCHHARIVTLLSWEGLTARSQVRFLFSNLFSLFLSVLSF